MLYGPSKEHENIVADVGGQAVRVANACRRVQKDVVHMVTVVQELQQFAQPHHDLRVLCSIDLGDLMAGQNIQKFSSLRNLALQMSQRSAE